MLILYRLSLQFDHYLLFYNARWYDSSLSRFAQADSIVPGRVQGLDRYAYVNNSPINYVDPSGHAQCRTQEECDDIGTTPMGGGSGLLGSPLSDTEMWMLVATVMAETSNGQFPVGLAQTITWTYLNRLTKGTHTNLFSAVQGQQSAFSCYYSGCKGKAAILPIAKGETWVDYMARFEEWALNGPNPSAWEQMFSLVDNVYNQWLNAGTGSMYDKAKGGTDFRIKYDTEAAEAMTPHLRNQTWSQWEEAWHGIEFNQAQTTYAFWERTVPGFTWFYVGPVHVDGTLNLTFYVFVSNQLELQEYFK